jgi:flagellar hook protein FlgE
MLRSMYSGVSGMKGFQTKLDVIGNNIANVNTIGYKKSRINFQDLLSQNLSDSSVNPMQVGLGTTISSVDVLHTPGSLMTTGVSSDLAIMGDGFFVVQKPQTNAQIAAGERPEEYLTRAGNFVVNSEGELVTSQGYNVLGIYDPDGTGANKTVSPIIIDPTVYDSYKINRLGEVIGKRKADGEDFTIANIGIVLPENPAGLRKVGGSIYEMTTNADGDGSLGVMNGNVFTYTDIQSVKDAKTEVVSGQLEMSNVDLTEEFTEMIVAQRGFQANSRIITTSDEILQEVVNLKR